MISKIAYYIAGTSFGATLQGRATRSRHCEPVGCRSIRL